MEKAIVTQVKSAIKRPLRQKRTLQALGIRKMNQSVEVVLTPQIEGMIRKINHLVKVDKV